MNPRNGLNNRKNEKKISKIISCIFGFYILLSFLAPLMMEEGSVPELSGRANAIDYATEQSWGNLENNDLLPTATSRPSTVASAPLPG